MKHKELFESEYHMLARVAMLRKQGIKYFSTIYYSSTYIVLSYISYKDIIA